MCEYRCAVKCIPIYMCVSNLSPDTFNEHIRNYVHARDANVDPCPAACRTISSVYVRTYARARVAPTFLDITPPFVRENKK